MQKFKIFKPLGVGRFKFKMAGLSLCVVFGFTAESQSQSIQAPIPEEPVIEPASEDGQAAISQFKFPANFECEMIAAEPDVANIVAFHRDYQGNIYVCETFRQEKGVEDNRNHAHWMDEELAAQTVQDRIDYVRKYIPDADKTYTAKESQIRYRYSRTDITNWKWALVPVCFLIGARFITHASRIYSNCKMLTATGLLRFVNRYTPVTASATRFEVTTCMV